MLRRNFPKNIDDFLLPDKEEFLQEIYVVGVQEACVDLYVKIKAILFSYNLLNYLESKSQNKSQNFVETSRKFFC